MSSNSEQLILGDVSEIKGRIGWRGYTRADLVDEGPIVIGGTEIKNNRLVLNNVNHLTREKYDESPEIQIERENIILTKTGNSIGDVAIVSEDIGEATINPNVALIKVDKNKYNPYFLYYYLVTPQAQSYLTGGSTASAQPAVNQATIKKLAVPNLPIQQQNEIAKILGDLDRKIELDRRMNETLEQIGQALFEKYFVDNPEKENWDKKALGEIADITIGRTPPRKEKEWFSRDERDKKWISIKDLGNSGVFIDSTSEYLTHEAVKKFRVPIIPQDTVVISFKLTVGRVSITSEEMCSNEAIAHIKTDVLPVEYTYFYCKNFDYSSLGSTSSIATAVNSETIRRIKVPIPNNEVLSEFRGVIEPLFKSIRVNNKNTNTLTDIRESLLPKLMSAQVKI